MFTKIPGWEQYSINTLGEVYSHKVNRLLTPRLNTSGYYFITFTDANKKPKHFLIHRLLAFVFLNLPSLDSELEVDHNDTVKTNNSLDNLVVRTKEEHRTKTLKVRGHTERRESDDFCLCGRHKERRASCCITCHNANRIISNKDITQEQIEYWVSNYSWVRAAKELGLSDNGLRKRYKTLSGKDPKSLTMRR